MLILGACLWMVCQAESNPPLLRPGVALIRREEKVLTENIHWKVVQYQDLGPISETLERLKTSLEVISTVVKRENSSAHGEARMRLVGHRLAFMTKGFREVLTGVKESQHCKSRVKRSLFDGVGRLLHSMFGLLDDRSGAEVKRLGAQTVAIKHHLSQQFTVLKDMANTLDLTTKEVARLDSHVRKLSLDLNRQIGEVNWEVQWNEKMDNLEAIIGSLDKEVQRACEVILMALTGHVSPRLLTDAVVEEVLQALGNTLGASFGDVIKDFAKMELVRCGYELIFTITLHIPQPVKWELTEVLSTPMQTEKGLVALKGLPSNIAQTDSEVIEFSNGMLDGCMKSKEFILCPRALTSPISVTESCVCMLERLPGGSNGIPNVCKTEWVKGFTPIFKVYNDLGDLLYSVNRTTPALLKCSSGSRRTIELKGTGYLHFPGDCALVINKGITVYSRRESVSTGYDFTSVHTNFSEYDKVLQDVMEPILSRDLRVVHDHFNQSKANLDKVNASINGLVKAIASIDQDNAVLFGRTDHHYVTQVNSWVGVILGPILIIISLCFTLYLWKRLRQERDKRLSLSRAIESLVGPALQPLSHSPYARRPRGTMSTDTTL